MLRRIGISLIAVAGIFAAYALVAASRFVFTGHETPVERVFVAFFCIIILAVLGAGAIDIGSE